MLHFFNIFFLAGNKHTHSVLRTPLRHLTGMTKQTYRWPDPLRLYDLETIEFERKKCEYCEKKWAWSQWKWERDRHEMFKQGLIPMTDGTCANMKLMYKLSEGLSEKSRLEVMKKCRKELWDRVTKARREGMKATRAKWAWEKKREEWEFYEKNLFF